jgi:hypothetical protein
MSSNNNNYECSLCLETKGNEDKVMTPCNHGPYCNDCYNKLNNSTKKCPICRTDLVNEEPDRVRSIFDNLPASAFAVESSSTYSDAETSNSFEETLPNANSSNGLSFGELPYNPPIIRTTRNRVTSGFGIPGGFGVSSFTFNTPPNLRLGTGPNLPLDTGPNLPLGAGPNLPLGAGPNISLASGAFDNRLAPRLGPDNPNSDIIHLLNTISNRLNHFIFNFASGNQDRSFSLTYTYGNTTIEILNGEVRIRSNTLA